MHETVALPLGDLEAGAWRGVAGLCQVSQFLLYLYGLSNYDMIANKYGMIDNKYGEYLAPEVKIIEFKSRGILCASGDTEDYADGTWNW